MTPADLPKVMEIADEVHAHYPEDAAVFAERLRLYPAGCLVLDRGGELIAYIVSHPWRWLAPPSLNTQLGELPADAATYYIHDIALLPAARGSGAAANVVEKLTEQAKAEGFSSISLIAVNGSTGFWSRHGFQVLADPTVERKLRSYDADARFMVRNISVDRS